MTENWAAQWLVDVAQAQALPGAEALGLGGASLAEAWGMVARACSVTNEDLAAAVARQFGLQTWDATARPERMAVRLLPENFARKHSALGVTADARKLVVAVPDPRDRKLVLESRRYAQRQVELRIAPPDAIDNWIVNSYASASTESRGTFVQPGSEAWQALFGDRDDPAAQLTAGILQQAYDQGATDIHIQPFVGGGLVRYRVDGLLRRGQSLPASVLRRVLNRVKVVAGMDITDAMRPHDGRARLVIGDDAIDLRVSTIPVDGTEKMVIRLLGHGRLPSFADLGFMEPAGSQVRDLLTRREGIAFVTGPTGSGKSTTLQACLALLNTVDVNIVTVENPVEYRVPGLAQVEIDEAKGLTYAAALRSILRQDPNVILVGEVRDAETADIAVQSALTGHPVLTTIHTRDAVGVIPRLLELGVPRTLIADAFTGATGQRLVRRLCRRCPAPVADPLSEVEARYARLVGQPPPKRAIGCAECGYTGYRGRLPVAQVLTATRALRDVILSNQASVADLRAAARDAGLRSLGEAAADAIRAGFTTPEEAGRALGSAFWSDLGQAARALGMSVADEAPGAAAKPAEAAGRMAVLVVSAGQDQRTQILGALTQHGFDAVGATDAASALRALAGEKLFGALVVNVDRAGAEAEASLAELYEALGPTGLPVVLVVDGEDASLRRSIEEHGVDDYLTRPFESEDVVPRRVQAALERQQATGR